MSKIELCIVEPDTNEHRQEIVESVLKSSLNLALGSLEFWADGNGKPRLRLAGGPEIFYSFSHARNVEQRFGIAAISLDMAVGIDVELWPLGHADPDFLLAISTKEDDAALSILNLSKRNSGIALWVIKEAALKCTGKVMIDPRCLAVTYESNGIFLVRSSAIAGAPNPDVRVRLLVLRRSHFPDVRLILGISMSADCDAGMIIETSLCSANQRWQIEDFATAQLL